MLSLVLLALLPVLLLTTAAPCVQVGSSERGEVAPVRSKHNGEEAEPCSPSGSAESVPARLLLFVEVLTCPKGHLVFLEQRNLQAKGTDNK